MINPYINIPADKANNPLQGYPAPFVAKARYGSSTTVASSVITLTDNTSVVEVTAGTGPVALRWVGAADTQASVIAVGGTANFDHVISAGDTRRFAVPIETYGVNSIVGINKQAGLYNRVAIVTAGSNSSVFTSEF